MNQKRGGERDDGRAKGISELVPSGVVMVE